MDITISVVMPVYNVAQYVERCLLSIMRQTFPATECIIVDDDSTDDSIARCKKLIDGYTGPTCFSIIHHSQNRGLSAARNTGTDAATSSYIYYVDSDDELAPDCLEKLATPVMHDDTIEMVMGAYRVDSPSMTIFGQQFAIQRFRFMKDMPTELRTNKEVYKWFYHEIRPVCVWNKLLKLSFIKDNQLYNKEGLLFEDSLWTFQLMRCLSHVAFVHDVTYIYHRNHFSIRAVTTTEEKNRHFGIIFNEMTNHIIHGERQEETARWVFLFCNIYIESYENPNFQHFYEIYHRELSNNHQRLAVCRLMMTHYLSKSKVGRLLYKSIIMRFEHLKRIFNDDIKIKKVAIK